MFEPSDEARLPAPELPSPKAQPRLSMSIELWFAEHFHGHAAMRDTETFNHVRRAVDVLKQRLEQESA